MTHMGQAPRLPGDTDRGTRSIEGIRAMVRGVYAAHILGCRVGAVLAHRDLVQKSISCFQYIHSYSHGPKCPPHRVRIASHSFEESSQESSSVRAMVRART